MHAAIVVVAGKYDRSSHAIYCQLARTQHPQSMALTAGSSYMAPIANDIHNHTNQHRSDQIMAEAAGLCQN